MVSEIVGVWNGIVLKAVEMEVGYLNAVISNYKDISKKREEITIDGKKYSAIKIAPSLYIVRPFHKLRG